MRKDLSPEEPGTTHKIVHLPLARLRAYPRNARTHSRQQLRQIARSIERFGFTNPVLVNDAGEILAGHGRVEAARTLGFDTVPTLCLSHLTPAQQRAYILADNKLALNAGWDRELLASELQGLIDMEFDVELTGFSLAEIDTALDEARAADPTGADEADDMIPPVPEVATSARGDIWVLGRHRLLCGDARDAESFARLMEDEAADLLFTDPPYNVKIDGHVSGLGRMKHREFAFASGEMSPEAFTRFLSDTLGRAAERMRDGAIAFVCMDWRHMGELLAAGEACFSSFMNLVVWNKTNGGMGSFYRSKHELIFVFKRGHAAHINSFGLGDTGRYRTNVWDYPGMSSIGRSRCDELALHPTVKPVALVADAIRDCSKRGQIVLDCFGGSGSTLIAAEKTGRSARIIEYDPLYCDVIVRRWEDHSGKGAVHAASGESFQARAEHGLPPVRGRQP